MIARTITADTILHRIRPNSIPCFFIRNASTATRKPRLVILGSGWGGYKLLQTLSSSTLSRYSTVLVSPTTTFSMSPLLAQAACSTLDFRSAIEPIHSTPTVEYHHAWCDSIDFSSQTLELASAERTSSTSSRDSEQDFQHSPASVDAREKYTMPYDKLVISVGAYNATFGTQGVKENALFLKDITDAKKIRWRILTLFERANTLYNSSSSSGGLSKETEIRLRNLLSFIVVGGGPTGSEFSAELHDLISKDLSRLYPNIVKYSSIKLLDAGTSILSSFDKGLAEFAMKKFARDGIDVHLGAKISRVTPTGIVLQSNDTNDKEVKEEMKAGMIVWSTGITTSPLIASLTSIAKEERTGKVLTDNNLNLIAANSATHGGNGAITNVWAIGDCASFQSGEILPATAQVASQKAVYLAKQFNSNFHSPSPFHWSDQGSMTSIGGNQALVDTPVKKQHGQLAWLLWRSVYTIKSMSWRNRLLVPANWLSNILFGRDVGRF